MQQVNIDLREGFKDAEGRFTFYTAMANASQQEALGKQRHVDIRSFVQADATVRVTMLYLNLFSVIDLGSQTMDDLNGSIVVRKGEAWTNGSVAPQGDRNFANGLQLSCTTGGNPNTTQSVMVTT